MFVLELEQFHEAHLLARGRDVPQRLAGVDEHHPRLVDIEDAHAPRRQPVKEFDDVVVIDERVGDLDQCPQHFALLCHCSPLPGRRSQCRHPAVVKHRIAVVRPKPPTPLR